MVFSTNLFLFLFLPIFLLVYYFLLFRFCSVCTLLASYVFYAWWRVDFAALFFVTMLVLGYLLVKSTTFTTTQKDTAISHQGDLLNYLPLGMWQERLGPTDTLIGQTTAATSESSGGALFGNSSIPVTLVGTSYSANPLWNFEDSLKEALGTDVLNVANQGEGPVVPMQEYLESQALKDAPPELVIWEIPERFLEVAYE
jgi:SGNH hydrolase-like domain, acetyltransferase AlgX